MKLLLDTHAFRRDSASYPSPCITLRARDCCPAQIVIHSIAC